MRWLGLLFQLGIFISGGLCFLSADDENWVMTAIYAGVGFGIWITLNVRIVTELEDEE